MPKSSPTALDLPKPELVEAEGAPQIDPLKLVDGATVRVSYDGMLTTDSIALYWESTFGEYAPIPAQDGVEAGSVEFHVPAYYVGVRIDNFALFSYTVTRDGEEHPSPSTDVFIKLPSNLPGAQILPSSDGVLDLSRLCCEDPYLYVPAWAFIDPSQVFRLYISGVRPDDTLVKLYIFEDAPITAEDVRNGLSRTVSRELLATLKHGSELYFAFSVEFMPRGASRPVYRLFPSKLLTVLTETHLELSPPTIVEAVEVTPGKFLLNPLNATNGATLRVAYDNLCPKDYVCAFWTGTPGAGSPYLSCQEAGTDGVVDFSVPASAISANFQDTVSVRYTVVREGRTWSSGSRDVHILNISDLPTPQVTQATGPVLDLNTFQGDASLTVSPWWFIDEAHPRWLWVTSELEDGTPYSFAVLQGESGSLQGVSEILPRSELQKLADCEIIRVHFAVNFNGQLDKATAVEFPVLELKLVQQDLNLIAPTVREAVGSVLNPYNGRDGVTLRVEYDHISPHQQIQPCWKRSDDSCWPMAAKPGNTDPGYVDFEVPREAVIAGMGKTVSINYSVSSQCKQATSANLELSITLPSFLPAPQVLEATDGTLDLRNFTGDAQIIVGKWWFIDQTQPRWLWVTSALEDGTPYSFPIVQGEPGSVDGVSEILPRSELLKLADCGTLWVHFAVSVDGQDDKATAVEFPVLELKLVQQDLNLEAPTVREAMGSVLNPYNGNDGVTLRVEYDHISPHHEIQPCWKRRDGSCWLIAAKPGNTDPGYVDFEVPREAVIGGINQTVSINYSVSSSCKQATSADLRLFIPEPPLLPVPRVPEATDGILDLRTFSGDAHVVVDKWWFILEGQRGWLSCYGVAQDGSSYLFRVMFSELITADDVINGVVRVLPREELQKFREGYWLTIGFAATADGSTRAGDSISFPDLKLILRQFYRDLTDFNDRTLGKWTIGSGAPDPRDITIEYLAAGPDGKPGYSVRDFTYTANDNVGPILQRVFDDLQPGYSYRFSVKVRRYSAVNPTPKLSLRKDTVQETPVIALVDLAWRTLSFTFVAGSEPVLLDIYSSEASGVGNDWYMDDFLVEGI